MGGLTDEIPKPLLRVLGKTLLEQKLEALPASISEVIFVVGYLKEQIMSFFGEEWRGMRIRYVVQDTLNGTDGAVRLVRDMVWDKFMVLMGDDLYTKEDLERMLLYPFAILAQEVTDPRPLSILKTDEYGNLQSVEEKVVFDGPRLMNAGAYVLGREFFDYEPVSIGNGEFGLPQTLAVIAKDRLVKVVKATGWLAVGSPEDLIKAEEFFKVMST